MTFHADKTMTQSRHPFLSVNQQLRHEFSSERTRNEVIEITCFRHGMERLWTWYLVAPKAPLVQANLKILADDWRSMDGDAAYWVNLTLNNAPSCNVEIHQGDLFSDFYVWRNERIRRTLERTIRQQSRWRQCHSSNVLLRYVLSTIRMFTNPTHIYSYGLWSFAD